MRAFKMIHIKPIPGKLVLQILQRHSTGIHFLILVLKALIVSEDFIYSGTMSHTFDPKNDKGSVSHLTVFTLLLSRLLFLRKLYLLWEGTKTLYLI